MFIVVVCTIWTGASYLTQFIYGELDFQSPFLFTYLSSSFFALYLPLWQVMVHLGWVTDPPPLRAAAAGPAAAYMELRQDGSDHGSGVELTAVGAAAPGTESSGGDTFSTAAATSASTASTPGKQQQQQRRPQLLPRSVALFAAIVADALRTLSLRPVPMPEADADGPGTASDTATATASSNSSNSSSISSNSSSGDGAEGAGADGPLDGAVPVLGYTHADMLGAALVLSPLWFLANCMYNYALLYTSVESSTVIRYFLHAHLSAVQWRV